MTASCHDSLAEHGAAPGICGVCVLTARMESVWAKRNFQPMKLTATFRLAPVGSRVAYSCSMDYRWGLQL